MAVHRLRAPRHDHAVLAQPRLSEVGLLLARNRQRLRQAAGTLFGRSWADVCREARQAAVTAAGDYLRGAGEPVAAGGAASLLMAGHQPELVHPGVWLKNFALHGLARQHHATPINLIVDNDTAKATGLHVPASSDPLKSEAFDLHPKVRLTLMPFDRGPAEEPYEERTVRDEALFTDFPARVADALPGWPFRPLLPAFWGEVRRQAQRTPLLGERIASARRAFERAWGCHNLELPVSALCRTEPFAWFACHLLADLGRFHEVYNACVADYRRQHGIRNRQHPVPDLAAEDGWREVPFWAWRTGQKRRGRLFARPGETCVELRAGDEMWPVLPLRPRGDPAPAVAAWLTLERQGLKVRSRALTNTLYVRLFLADLFIHGIGGGKYDEVTDAIVRRFYGFEPPEFLVLSATLFLPLPVFPVRPEDVRRLARRVRDVRYNPQRHLVSLPPEVRELLVQKQDWIARPVNNKAARRARFHALRTLNEKLRPFLGGMEDQLEKELIRSREQLAANEVLQRRDYAFCLFPEAAVRPFCTQFL
jgi:hypothetical protein